jgi:hypothetical protein
MIEEIESRAAAHPGHIPAVDTLARLTVAELEEMLDSEREEWGVVGAPPEDGEPVYLQRYFDVDTGRVQYAFELRDLEGELVPLEIDVDDALLAEIGPALTLYLDTEAGALELEVFARELGPE